MANKRINTTDLIPDNLNANEGTMLGADMLRKSFEQFGAARSVLIDKNNRIIAGNKSVNAAIETGIEDVLIVETQGDAIVAVKRTDIDLDSKDGRELAIADNATALANISWSEMALEQLGREYEISGKEWGVEIPDWSEEQYKPNLNPTTDRGRIERGDIDRANGHLEDMVDNWKTPPSNLYEVCCPECGYTFDIKLA